MYREYKNLNLAEIDREVLTFWDAEKIFEKSVDQRDPANSFVFYEGPPSANGMPGIHHVMARAIKDIFCRFQTMQGKRVERKGGWDTHGLPIELSVEKELGITKEDIGKSITVEEYNRKCRETVMRYKDLWDDITRKMGYWVDLQHPYITYENEYIESVWYLLRRLYDKGLLYKGYTIQPYSPAAGTGLSTHELNMPGTYKEVSDTSVVALFKVKPEGKAPTLFAVMGSGPDYEMLENVYLAAWTTTPWTLPSNTALTVGKNIYYQLVETINPYTFDHIYIILAEDLIGKWFGGKNWLEVGDDYDFSTFKEDDKKFPFRLLNNMVYRHLGSLLEGIQYEQLLPYGNPIEPLDDKTEAFRVLIGDFVTTEDGTGIVHTAPSFGADDMQVARANGIGALTLVDKQGKFKDSVGEFSNRYVKNYQDDPNYTSVDIDIAVKLKLEGKVFNIQKYVHNYPHCWRTDKPVLYYPLDSWFVRASAMRERMYELNQTINWKPAATGEGRFSKWLENLQDWNLSRSRYWGIGLPIWKTEDGEKEVCVGTLKDIHAQGWFYCLGSKYENWRRINKLNGFELFLQQIENYNRRLSDKKKKIDYKGIKNVINEKNFTLEDWRKFNVPYDLLLYNNILTSLLEGTEKIDLHRPFIDNIFFVDDVGKVYYRESDLIDVWFDSGSMPYAQWHYPMENEEKFKANFPADFIAEGVDQTRGWFYTLHAIATMVYDSVAFKNVVSNGLVLDKNGQKMSKRLGNAVDPFKTIAEYGADATRWYMISNSQPWDNLKFDIDGVAEVRTKLFGKLYNIYSFFALYANVDRFVVDELNIIPVAERSELDRWVISKLHSLVREVTASYADYEPTRAARAIETFVDEHLSNWYVRLSRRRFWKGEMSPNKKAAYETLFECLMVTTQLMAPIAPFFTDWVYKNMTDNVREKARQNNTPLAPESVHLTLLTKADEKLIDTELEQRMDYAQRISSLVLSLRKKEKIRVRQPLRRLLLPILDASFHDQVEAVKDLILAEVNIKEVEYVTDTAGLVHKKIKPNFKTLGKRLGKHMKAASDVIGALSQEDISRIEKENHFDLQLDGESYALTLEDFEISAEDIPGWQVATDGDLTVALDITLDDELLAEGIARDLVNRIQNIRKEREYNVTHRIVVRVEYHETILPAIEGFSSYIQRETLATSIKPVKNLRQGERVELFGDEFLKLDIKLVKKTAATEARPNKQRRKPTVPPLPKVDFNTNNARPNKRRQKSTAPPVPKIDTKTIEARPEKVVDAKPKTQRSKKTTAKS